MPNLTASLKTSYHDSTHVNGDTLILQSDLFDCVGDVGFDVTFAISNSASAQQQNWFLRDVTTIPEPIIDTCANFASLDREVNTLTLKHPQLSAWLDGTGGFYLVYSKDGVRIVRLDEKGQGPCAKQSVVALVVTDGENYAGTNRCANPQNVCPRDVAGMQSGEGYHLCKDICQQVSHAEVDAICNAGKYKASDATIFLTGHSYACTDCKSAINNAEIKELRVINSRIG